MTFFHLDMIFPEETTIFLGEFDELPQRNIQKCKADPEFISYRLMKCRLMA